MTESMDRRIAAALDEASESLAAAAAKLAYLRAFILARHLSMSPEGVCSTCGKLGNYTVHPCPIHPRLTDPPQGTRPPRAHILPVSRNLPISALVDDLRDLTCRLAITEAGALCGQSCRLAIVPV